MLEWTAAMFGAYGFSGTSTVWELQSWSYISLIPVMIVGSLPWAPWLRKKLEAWAKGDSGTKIIAAPEKGNDMVPPCQANVAAECAGSRMNVVMAINIMVDIALFAVLVASSFSVVSSSYNPFIYFQF